MSASQRVARRLRRYRRRAAQVALAPLESRREPLAKAAAERIGGGLWLRLRPPFPPSAEECPRYGYGRPPHRRLTEILARGDDAYGEVLESFARHREELLAIPMAKPGPQEPFWGNMSLFGIDGVSLYCFMRQLAPKLYLEVGSGNSTLFVDRARRDGALDSRIVSIDPGPRFEIDAVCDRIVRSPLESIDLDVFGELQAGDILFMDGTHRVFMNNDATVFFLDVLPELPAGVLVGIHDIHLPDDYRPEHVDHYYSEQYMLASYLLAESPWLETVLPCWYASSHPRLGALAESLLPPAFLTAPGPGGAAGVKRDSRGVIFWLRTRERAG